MGPNTLKPPCRWRQLPNIICGIWSSLRRARKNGVVLMTQGFRREPETFLPPTVMIFLAPAYHGRPLPRPGTLTLIPTLAIGLLGCCASWSVCSERLFWRFGHIWVFSSKLAYLRETEHNNPPAHRLPSDPFHVYTSHNGHRIFCFD